MVERSEVSGTVNGDLLEVQIEAGLEYRADAKEWLLGFERVRDPVRRWAQGGFTAGSFPKGLK